MKTILIFIFISLSLFLKAQIFVEISNGYAFPLQKLTLAYPYFNGSDDVYSSKESPYFTERTIIKKKPAKMNFGTGYQKNGSIGYYIGKYFGLSITYNYNNTLNDFNEKKTYYYNSTYDYYGNPQGNDELVFTFNSINKSYLLNSIFKYPINKKICPFIKLGISHSIHEIFVKRIDTFKVGNSSSSDGFKEKYYGNYSIGGILSLGITYNIKNFAFLFECKFILDKYTPTRLYSYDYYDTYMVGLPLYDVPADHEVTLEDYSNGGDYKSNKFNPAFSEARYKNTFAYSTFSLNIGIQYTFRFKKKDKTKKE